MTNTNAVFSSEVVPQEWHDGSAEVVSISQEQTQAPGTDGVMISNSNYDDHFHWILGASVIPFDETSCGGYGWVNFYLQDLDTNNVFWREYDMVSAGAGSDTGAKLDHGPLPLPPRTKLVARVYNLGSTNDFAFHGEAKVLEP